MKIKNKKYLIVFLCFIVLYSIYCEKVTFESIISKYHKSSVLSMSHIKNSLTRKNYSINRNGSSNTYKSRRKDDLKNESNNKKKEDVKEKKSEKPVKEDKDNKKQDNKNENKLEANQESSKVKEENKESGDKGKEKEDASKGKEDKENKDKENKDKDKENKDKENKDSKDIDKDIKKEKKKEPIIHQNPCNTCVAALEYSFVTIFKDKSYKEQRKTLEEQSYEYICENDITPSLTDNSTSFFTKGKLLSLVINKEKLTKEKRFDVTPNSGSDINKRPINIEYDLDKLLLKLIKVYNKVSTKHINKKLSNLINKQVNTTMKEIKGNENILDEGIEKEKLEKETNSKTKADVNESKSNMGDKNNKKTKATVSKKKSIEEIKIKSEKLEANKLANTSSGIENLSITKSKKTFINFKDKERTNPFLFFLTDNMKQCAAQKRTSLIQIKKNIYIPIGKIDCKLVEGNSNIFNIGNIYKTVGFISFYDFSRNKYGDTSIKDNNFKLTSYLIVKESLHENNSCPIILKINKSNEIYVTKEIDIMNMTYSDEKSYLVKRRFLAAAILEVKNIIKVSEIATSINPEITKLQLIYDAYSDYIYGGFIEKARIIEMEGKFSCEDTKDFAKCKELEKDYSSMS